MQNDKGMPIDIETFAAYLDGVLPMEEMERIGRLIEKDDRLRSILETCDSVDAFVEDYCSNEVPEIDDIRIPDLETIRLEDLQNDNSTIWDDNVEIFLREEEEKLLAMDDLTLQGNEDFVNDIIKPLEMKELKTYGYEPNYKLDKFDPNIFQGYDNTCAIRSQQIVLRDYGIMIPQEELMKYATDKGWFDPDPENGGTEPQFAGNLLDDCGIETIRTEDATIYDIIAELRAGHRVMVAVDADELWLKKEPNLFKRLFQNFVNHGRDYIQDAANIEGANHALIVAGVNVNPSDPSDIHVTLIDTGTGEMCVEYTLKEFDEAWKDSHHFMVATTIPAPYQYNSETHQMEPSGFETDYIPSTHEIPYELQNIFKLSDSYYESFDEYNPVYSEDSSIEYSSGENQLDEQPDSGDSNENKGIDDSSFISGDNNSDSNQDEPNEEASVTDEDIYNDSEQESYIGSGDNDEDEASPLNEEQLYENNEPGEDS